MNLALPAVVFILLALPGFLARRSYLSGAFSKRHVARNAPDELLIGLVISLPLQSLWGILYAMLATKYSWPQMPWDIVLRLVTSQFDSTTSGFSGVIAPLKDRWILIGLQQGALWAAAAGGGHSLRILVRKTGLDRTTRFWRFGNQWYYLLSGEARQLPGFGQLASADAAFIWVDVLTRCGDILLLYSGVPVEYILNNKGGLETLYLVNAEVRRLGPDGPVSLPARTPIAPSSVFIIRGDEILNVNIAYLPEPAGKLPTAVSAQGTQED